MRSCWPCKIVV